MTEEAYRRMVLDAAMGLEALNVYTEHRLTLADYLEAEGFDQDADEIREDWSKVWACLSGTPRVTIAEELHDMMLPCAADDMLPAGA